MTIIRLGAELDAGPIAAQQAFPLGPEDDFGTVSARAAELGAELLEDVLAGPSFTPQPAVGATYAEKIGPADRELDLSEPPRRAAEPDPRPLAAHRRPCRAARAAGDDLEGEGRGRPARPRRGAAGGAAADGLRRVPARAAVISPARRAAYDTVLRVFEDDAYADRAFPAAAAGLDPRDRALAQRLAYGTIQRVRTLDHGIEALGKRPVREARPAGARCAPARRLPARLLGGRGARGRQRVGRARPRRRARARRVVRERGPAAPGARPARPRRLAPGADGRRGGAPALLSGLGRGAVVARARPRPGARADGRAERAAGDRRPPQPAAGGSGRGHARSGHPRGAARRAGGRESPAQRANLAAEPRVAACRPLRGQRRGGAHARPLRGARRQGDPARRRGDGGREAPGPRAGAGGELRPPRRHERAGAQRRRARAARRAARLRPRARRRALLGPRRPRLAPGPALARPAAARPAARARFGWPPSGCGPAGRSSTRSARSPPRRTKGSSMRQAWRSSRSAGSGRSSRTRAGPSSC